MLSIPESGMTFGPYPDDHCFYIEKSALYKNLPSGIKIAEFLLIRSKKDQVPALWIVEAKSSSPRQETQPNFDHFIAEISDKLVNTFSLGLASCLRRHKQATEELPEPFYLLDLSEIEIRFILVINGHQDSWLPPLQDALKRSLRTTIETWALSPCSVIVLNERFAQEYGLISKTL
ncbi:MAG: hypothetical protein D3916_12450 [Candidatus Electrothrix sp. MAN1_4]|nr:hypothetical protein [Candidatus Electrothrix sp. MAN1_4]